MTVHLGLVGLWWDVLSVRVLLGLVLPLLGFLVLPCRVRLLPIQDLPVQRDGLREFVLHLSQHFCGYSQ